MRIRGKNLTAIQKAVLRKRKWKEEDINKYLYKKQIIEYEDNGSKHEYWNLINRENGELLKILISSTVLVS